jgi:hypothetical protein
MGQEKIFSYANKVGLATKNALAIKCPFLLLTSHPGAFIKNFPAKRQGTERQRTVYVAAIQITQFEFIRIGFVLGIIIHLQRLWAKT